MGDQHAEDQEGRGQHERQDLEVVHEREDGELIHAHDHDRHAGPAGKLHDGGRRIVARGEEGTGDRRHHGGRGPVRPSGRDPQAEHTRTATATPAADSSASAWSRCRMALDALLRPEGERLWQGPPPRRDVPPQRPAVAARCRPVRAAGSEGSRPGCRASSSPRERPDRPSSMAARSRSASAVATIAPVPSQRASGPIQARRARRGRRRGRRAGGRSAAHPVGDRGEHRQQRQHAQRAGAARSAPDVPHGATFHRRDGSTACRSRPHRRRGGSGRRATARPPARPASDRG